MALRTRYRHARAPVPADRCRRILGSRDDSEPLAAINATANALPPAAIGEIPLDRLAQAGFEAFARLPAEIGGDLCGIDRIAKVVSRAVRHERDQRAARSDFSVRRKL